MNLAAKPSMASLSTANTTTSLSVTNASMLLTMAVFTVFGNGLVLVILWKDPARELRSMSNLLIANLAISDLILGLFGEPLFASNHWIGNSTLYLTSRCVIDLSLVSSFMSILALSLESYFMLKTEGRFRSSFRRLHVIACTVAIWTLSTIISSLIFAFSEENYKFILAFGVGAPIFVVMLIVYIKIYLVIKRVYRKDYKTIREAVDSSIDEVERKAERIRAKELKVAWTIFTIVGVLFFFWIPAIVSDALGKFCAPVMSCHLDKNLSDSMVIIGFLNAAFNPVVYSLRTKKFRKAVHLILFASSNNSKSLMPLIA
ncbi:alpha-1B adrenergic receptor-like [Actinia tenebrosa]|uniref:Alpha-1B adrenergic receptor-like n=1 Tax=Actinia tenebrosa TaxID=6105 RepID=A0A6P8I851_ACTTE|nr:alpha-1B adrenergic receptor-like [Actinia tenebrosa]